MNNKKITYPLYLPTVRFMKSLSSPGLNSLLFRTGFYLICGLDFKKKSVASKRPFDGGGGGGGSLPPF